jgi:Probable taurine catabolism dioxygenase
LHARHRAELSNISLADAPWTLTHRRNPGAVAEAQSLFFRDQNIRRWSNRTSPRNSPNWKPIPLPEPSGGGQAADAVPQSRPSKPKSFVEKASRENLWHADVTFKKAPPRGAVLRCELGPESGGDTMWSNMVMAYEKLPDSIKQRIAGLYAKHSSEHTFGAQMPIEERHAMAARNPAAEHPVVLTHPETGEKVLFVNSTFTTHFSNFFNFEDIRTARTSCRRLIT